MIKAMVEAVITARLTENITASMRYRLTKI